MKLNGTFGFSERPLPLAPGHRQASMLIAQRWHAVVEGARTYASDCKGPGTSLHACVHRLTASTAGLAHSRNRTPPGRWALWGV